MNAEFISLFECVYCKSSSPQVSKEAASLNDCLIAHNCYNTIPLAHLFSVLIFLLSWNICESKSQNQ